MSALRVWLVGFGVVGRWLASALDTQAGRLATRYGRAVTVVGIANARDGFVYDAGGLDLASVLAAAAGGRPITGQQGARVWPSAIEGLLLASHCKPGARIPALLPDAAQLLLTYEWPGNVRELENVMQRALVLCEGDLIRAAHIAFEPAGAETRAAGAAASHGAATVDMPQNQPALVAPACLPGGALADSLALAERQIILEALRAHASRERAAEQLGISARTLRYKLARLRAAGVDLSNEVQMAGSIA